jgi:hypothetical protein
MRTIIAGSRTCDNIEALHLALSHYDFDITEIVCGKARGADTLGEIFGKDNGIKIAYYPAEWHKYGKSAGYKRNKQMAENADALICLWDGISAGSKNMIKLAKEYNLKALIFNYVTNEVIEKYE